MKFPNYIIVVTALLLSGCYSQNLSLVNTIESEELEVTVPPGNDKLLGHLKNEFLKAGWKTTLNPARYKLLMTYRQWDWCFNFEPALKYDISLIEPATGKEIIAMSGGGCPTEIAKDFVTAVKQLTIDTKQNTPNKKEKRPMSL
jgi:hypothetical protein